MSLKEAIDAMMQARVTSTKTHQMNFTAAVSGTVAHLPKSLVALIEIRSNYMANIQALTYPIIDDREALVSSRMLWRIMRPVSSGICPN